MKNIYLNNNPYFNNAFNVHDTIKFINKSDNDIIINAYVLRICEIERRVYFTNIDYPNIGSCNMIFDGIDKYWDIIKVGL